MPETQDKDQIIPYYTPTSQIPSEKVQSPGRELGREAGSLDLDTEEAREARTHWKAQGTITMTVWGALNRVGLQGLLDGSGAWKRSWVWGGGWQG